MTTADALGRAAVGDHRDCALRFRLAEQPIPLRVAARRYGAAYRILENVPPGDVITTAGPARVLERHACLYRGQRFGHVVLAYRGERVSLLMAIVERAAPPALSPQWPPHPRSAGRIDDLSAVFFGTSRYMVFVTGDLPEADLIALTEALAAPLSRELSGT